MIFIDESLSEGKLANLPQRIELLDKKTQELLDAKQKIIQFRAEKKRKREEKPFEKEKSKKRKIERENKFSAISATLKSQNYTKLAVPALKQIKRFLKKEKSLSNDEISSITEENVIEKWEGYV